MAIERCKFTLVVIPSPFSSIVSPYSVNHLNSLKMCSGDRDNTLMQWGTIRMICAIATARMKLKSIYRLSPFPSAKALAEYPNKNSNNRKIASAWETMERGNHTLYGRGLSSSLSPSHRPPSTFFFPLSKLPTKNTKGSLSNNDGDAYKIVT